MTEAHDESDPDIPQRRPRYRGSHPRRFDQRYKEQDPERFPEIQEHIKSQGRTPAGTHVPIMVQEVLECLKPEPGQIVCDCTIGYAGHAIEFLKRIGPTGRLIGFDVDGANIERAGHRLEAASQQLGFKPNLSLMRRNYAGVAGALATKGLDGVDILFADVGVSSMQVDDPTRGFSYKHPNSPLDMRMDDRIKKTAADLLQTISRAELSRILWEFSDEPDHDIISQHIIDQRHSQPLKSTGDLIRLIFQSKGTDEKRWRQQAAHNELHPAARTFQALRILVNDELGALRQLLRVAPTCLRPGARFGIISFHSGEDRLVKQALRDGYKNGIYAATAKEVIKPSAEEIANNPRSRSAKLRWAHRAQSNA